jgi:hypothetical protein
MPKSLKLKSKSKSAKISAHTISIRFIRKDDVNNAGTRDDVAKITSTANDVYTISIRNVDEDKTTRKEMTVDDAGVYEWLESTLQLLDADYIPFEHYQFDFPMMPSVIIHHREMHHHLSTILEAMAFHLENWPKRYDVPNYDEDEDEMTGIPRHLYFDDEEEDDGQPML